MLFKNPAAIIIHLALVVIVAGALITHFCGVQGTVTLNFGGEPQCSFEVTSGPSEGRFPFFVQAQSGRVEYRAGTSSPGDFATDLKLSDGDGKEVGRARVSMNRVPQLMGWRFYQTAIGAESTTLTVSHDPVGIAVTYSGYVLLGAGMLMFFFHKKVVLALGCETVGGVVCCVHRVLGHVGCRERCGSDAAHASASACPRIRKAVGVERGAS